MEAEPQSLASVLETWVPWSQARACLKMTLYGSVATVGTLNIANGVRYYIDYTSHGGYSSVLNVGAAVFAMLIGFILLLTALRAAGI